MFLAYKIVTCPDDDDELDDVAIARDARPGPRRLLLLTRDGSAEVPFEVAAPLPREGRFQGFSSDDVIYLLMPDRFSNGDASNDDPAESQVLLDRGKARFYHGGDLQGVIDRLPYLKDLGVTAIWLMPFCPSPLRDDGNDIADYTSVHPDYGNLDNFREFLEAAHARDLRVITELVINHTSDQHPWFQRARRAPPGSVERDFYVWSDAPRSLTAGCSASRCPSRPGRLSG